MVRICAVVLIAAVALGAWALQSARPPPQKTCGAPGGPAVTAAGIRLRDGRHLAYKESGVPREKARFKIVFVHGFDRCRHDVTITAFLPPRVIEEFGVNIISFDRPGYGESDPDPYRTPKSIALDVEELADQLNLGDKFYLTGYSLGGQTVWSSLKYIPHRLAGAALMAPVVNYWWTGFPANLSNEAFHQQLTQDQWMQRAAHYVPWLTYWWNTQKFFPASSVVSRKPDKLNRQDLELMPKIMPLIQPYKTQVKQQGEYESIHRDLMIAFGKWEFSPLEIEKPFPDNEVGSVHLWQGDEDGLVPVTLQRYIAKTLPWIQYHEIPGGGHLFGYTEGMAEAVLRALLDGQS